jgi:hypothetical protein
MAQCAEVSGDQVEWKRLAERAAADADASGSVEIFVDAAIQRAGFGQPDAYDDTASSLLRRALAVIGHERPDLRALVLSRVAFAEKLVLGAGETADALAAEAVLLARRSGDRRVLYGTLAARASMTQSTSEVDEQRSLLREMAELEGEHEIDVDAPGVPFRIPFNAGNRLRCEAMVRLRLGDLAGFDATVEEIAERGRARRDWLLVAVAEASRALRALLDGRFGDVPAHADEMARVGGHDLNIRNFATSIRFKLAREVGTLPQLESIVAGLPRRPGNSAVAHASLAALYADTGRLNLAHQLVAEFLSPTVDHVAATVPGSVMAIFAEVCCEVHDAQRTAELYEHLLPYAGQLLVYSWGYSVTGTADRYLAQLAIESGRPTEAEERFAAALALEESLPSPPLAARTKFHWGEWLVGLGGKEERRRGLALLDEAEGLATQMGMNSISRRAAAVKVAAEPRLLRHMQ